MSTLVRVRCSVILILLASCASGPGYSDDRLMASIRSGDLIDVKRALGAGADIDYIDGNGDTPLLVAIKAGHKEIVNTLLSHGADIEHAGKFERTPLFAAVEIAIQGIGPDNGTGIEFAELLLESGANPNRVVSDGITETSIFDFALSNLLFKRFEDDAYFVIKKMIEKGADINKSVGVPVSPLKKSVQAKDRRVIELLVCAGARPGNSETDIGVKMQSKNSYQLSRILPNGKAHATYEVSCKD